MPKRCSGGCCDGGRAAKRRRRHLYLVLDDWLGGYSIRRVDLSPDTDSDEAPHDLIAISGEGAALRLPPAVFRLEAPHQHPDSFVAFGTKIIGLCPPHLTKRKRGGAVPVFDVQTRSFSIIPRPKVKLVDPIYFSLDERLFVMSSRSFMMIQSPLRGEPSWEWCELPKNPFKSSYAISYGAHPDGRTIFVSTHTGGKNRSSAATFTFDTAEPHRKWKRYSKWALPFTGRAYFDGELDTWVGLYGGDDPDADGHLCACDVALSNRSSCSEGRGLTWKLSKETLFSEDPAEKHVGATLVYMGGRSKFCLVQCVSIDDDDNCDDDDTDFYSMAMLDEWGGTCRFLFRLTTFSLKFGKDGQLTTGDSRRVRYYKAPAAAALTLDNLVAFWM